MDTQKPLQSQSNFHRKFSIRDFAEDLDLQEEIIRIVSNRVGRRQAEDAYQTAMVLLLARPAASTPTFATRAMLRNYLSRAVSRLGLRVAHAGDGVYGDGTGASGEETFKVVFGAESEMIGVVDPAPSRLDEMLEEERTAALRERVVEVLQGLPPATREIWTLLLHTDKKLWYSAVREKYHATYTQATDRIKRAMEYKGRFEHLCALAQVQRRASPRGGQTLPL